MRAQTRLRAAPRDAAQRPQHPCAAEHGHPRGPRPDQRRQAVQQHGCIVEHVRREPVHLALGLDGRTDAVCEEDRRDPAGRVLQDVQEEGGRGRGGGVADADAWDCRQLCWHGCFTTSIDDDDDDNRGRPSPKVGKQVREIKRTL